MRCPYCDIDMKEGEIVTYQANLVWWQPLGYGTFVMRKKTIKNRGGVLLRSVFSKNPKSYHCEKCKKIIVDAVDS